MQTCDVCIIGGGIMGASAAVEIARRGASVILLDQVALPNPRAASVDHSKVFRFAYSDPLYVRMAVDALGCWRALERATGRALLVPAGLVALGQQRPGFETACHETLQARHLDTELWEREVASARFPQFTPDAYAFAVFDPSGAILRAEEALCATLELARLLGVTVREREHVLPFTEAGVRTAQGTRIACDTVVVTAGPWTRGLFPEVAAQLRTTRQEVFYFEPRQPEVFAPGRFPIFLELSSGFYGFPVHHGRAMKIANHHKGPVVDPERCDDAICGETECREFFQRLIPELANARLVETRVCMYNNTPDDDFIIDWHPVRKNVLLATGFSGHGFKFGPLVGRLVAEMIAAQPSSHPLERFSLRRFS